MDDLENVLEKLNNKKPEKPKKEFTEVLDIKIPKKIEVADNEWNKIINSSNIKIGAKN
ncbi:MAG: hypothetical protein LBL93_05210 [Ruminococcus sp.]|jgi:hypothetical protein|nr:hypothetical protein [Ruminococcus sp.]